MADSTKAELSAKLKEANANLAKALETIEKLNAAVNTLTEAAQNQASSTQTKVEIPAQNTTSSINTDVSIVWMVDWPGYLKGNNFEYYLNTAGEEIIMPRYVFDELVGKYRHWFNDGMLAVSYKNVDIASAKKLKTDKEYVLSSDKIRELGNMSDIEIKELWNSLTTKNEKLSLITAFKRGIIEETPGFKDVSKVSVLNGLTEGGFSRELDELSGKIKYQPIDLNA